MRFLIKDRVGPLIFPISFKIGWNNNIYGEDLKKEVLQNHNSYKLYQIIFYLKAINDVSMTYFIVSKGQIEVIHSFFYEDQN